jgi:hypothetical protein
VRLKKDVFFRCETKKDVRLKKDAVRLKKDGLRFGTAQKAVVGGLTDRRVIIVASKTK